MDYAFIKSIDFEKINANKKNEILKYQFFLVINESNNLKCNCLFHKKLNLIIIFIIIIYHFKRSVYINLFDYKYKNFIRPNLYSLSNYFDDINQLNEINFNLTSVNFSFIDKSSVIKVTYNIDFYYKNSNLKIEPSDLALYKNFHVLCIKKEIKSQLFTLSLSNIIQNKQFGCIFFFNIDEQLEFGIKIYQDKKKYTVKKYMNKKYFFFFNNMNFIKVNNYNLKKSKNKIILSFNKWVFIDLYNYKLCLCKGFKCKYELISKECKYYFYLNIIENNKKIFNKTDFLFGDFIYNEFSTDDAYPIFEKMLNFNMPVHYLTQRIDIYDKYCKLVSNCLTIIPVKKDEIIDGDFLEKYLSLILKLKATISGAEFFSINNLFYNIDYITHISLGHGVSFFKSFLYENDSYYGCKRYNKILIPPSKRLISSAIKYGWIEDNIIKINLPRWDKYSKNLIENGINFNNKSIFIMFTWRHLKEYKSISNDYFNNIRNLINNKLLIKTLIDNNVTMYFCFHHQIKIDKLNMNYNKYVKYIKENEISDILLKVNLLITDFSSIIFDMIYRKRPYIIYIPDSNNTYNKDNYNENYYRLIKEMANGKIHFKNIFFNLKKVIKKIIFYINNNFKLEKYLEIFYKSFNFKTNNGTISFINYLKHLKI